MASPGAKSGGHVLGQVARQQLDRGGHLCVVMPTHSATWCLRSWRTIAQRPDVQVVEFQMAWGDTQGPEARTRRRRFRAIVTHELMVRAFRTPRSGMPPSLGLVADRIVKTYRDILEVEDLRYLRRSLYERQLQTVDEHQCNVIRRQIDHLPRIDSTAADGDGTDLPSQDSHDRVFSSGVPHSIDGNEEQSSGASSSQVAVAVESAANLSRSEAGSPSEANAIAVPTGSEETSVPPPSAP